MTTRRTMTAGLAALAAVSILAITTTAQAGIRGLLSVYNQSSQPYHIFVEGQRMGTVLQGQTMNIPVNDWNGPTQLLAVQAGSRGQVQFQKLVPTCQVARWELHTHWEQLQMTGGPTYGGPGGPGHFNPGPGHGAPGMPGHVNPGHGHGGPGHGMPLPPPPRPGHHGYGHPGLGPHGPGFVQPGPSVGQGVGMIVHGTQRQDPGRGTEIAAGILTIIASAQHRR